MNTEAHSLSKSGKMERSFSKVLRVQVAPAVAPVEGMKKTKTREKIKSDVLKNRWVPSTEDGHEAQNRVFTEAFLARLFASVSAVKAAYAQMQFAQSPYDADGIQSADQMIISELKNVSGLKQSYIKKQLNETPPETALLLSEIQEQRNLLKIYEITSRKLDSERKHKDSKIASLKEKLAEAGRYNKSLEKKLNASGQLTVPDNTRLSDLRPSHFVAYFRQTLKVIRSFVQLLIRGMESAGWNLDDAARAIEPGVTFWKPSHKCYAFESYVCSQMFDGFNNLDFSSQSESAPEHVECHRLHFNQFLELKSARPTDYLAWKPKSPFATFCWAKYLSLMHPKMEACFFGNLEQRNLVDSGDVPDTPFFSAFSEMARHVWLLHCLALSFDPTVTIFQASKGIWFSEVYMESLSDEAFSTSDGTLETEPRVAFTAVPGFRVGTTVIQCQVYLSSS